MRALQLSFLVLTIGFFTNACAHEFTVFGYLPEYRTANFDYEAAFQTGLTHLIYFSLEVHPTLHTPSALDRLPPKEDVARARAAADKVGGKLLLGFGGNARSQGFDTMTATPATRKTFLTALDELLSEYQLDGVDYNWEYPRNQQEWLNWGDLMRETKGFILGGRRDKNVVTFTMYNDPNHYQVIKAFKLLADADYVHCMVYDMRGKHSTVNFAKQSLELAETNFGPLKSKWTLGLPFYGRHVTTGEPQAFYDLHPRIPNNSTNMVGHMYYNSAQTIRKKVRLARAAGVGGVMVWELGQDVQPMDMPESLMNGLLAGLVDVGVAPASKGTGGSGKDEL